MIIQTIRYEFIIATSARQADSFWILLNELTESMLTMVKQIFLVLEIASIHKSYIDKPYTILYSIMNRELIKSYPTRHVITTESIDLKQTLSVYRKKASMCFRNI